jgi:hypothetical protein
MTTTKITVSHPATFQTPIIAADGLSYNMVVPLLGSYRPRVDYGSPAGNLNVDVHDFNADGNLDLVTYLDSHFDNPLDSGTPVLLGDGKGGFTVPAPLATNFFIIINDPNDFGNTSSVADFNADGKDDLVEIINSYGVVDNSYIAVSLGSSGGYAVKTLFDVGSVSPRFVGVADFNNDGKPDLITVNNHNISVLLNTTISDSLPTGELSITGKPLQNEILTVSNNLADVDGLGSISYQWFSNNSTISGATQNTYIPSYLDVGKTIGVVASYTDGLGNLESVQNSTDAVVANVNDLPTGTVSIVGNPAQGQTLGVSGKISDLDGMGDYLSFQWVKNGVDISGATTDTFTLTQAEVGKTISVKASYTDLFGASESVASSGVLVANTNDLPTGSVTITGTPTQGQILTASNALVDLDGLGKFSYQWQANGKVISGATASSYKLTQEEVGKTVSVKANYTDLFGASESVASSATVVVANVNDLPIGLPTILGKLIQGETLNVSGSIYDEDGVGDFSVQWLSVGKVISDAIQGSYILTQADVGKVISAKISYIDGQGTAENVTSSATTKVTNVNDLPTGSVTISGNPTQGQVLTAENTLIDADGLGSLSYQWFANGKIIKDGTDYTYTPTQTEIGKALSVKVNYVDGQGTKESVTSSDTALVTNSNHLPTGNIVIKGAAKVEQVLSLTSTLEDADGLGDFSYQWLSDGKEIKNATQDTYKLLKLDIGSKISVNVSYTDGEGTDELMTSVATAKVVTNISAKPSKGNDQLVGTDKNDKLSSLAGDDTLVGGQGVDTLTGGKGADTFVFNNESESWITSTTRDTITDFNHNENDKIDLSAIDANEKLAGDQAFMFIGSAAFNKTNASGQLRFDATSKILYGSTDADSKPEFSIQLNGVKSLAIDDFIL